MTLCRSSMEAFVRLGAVSVSDGTGGREMSVFDGEGFSAVVVPGNARSGAGRKTSAGGREEGAETVTVVTDSGTVLGFSEYIRRVSDGAVFRVLSDGEDTAPPAGAVPSPAMRLRTVSAVRCVGAGTGEA